MELIISLLSWPLKAFSKYQCKGKRKELSPQDAAVIIQMTFRSHLIRRSQVVRCLRQLAVAKAKLKEIRSLFYNFSYRRRIASDAEERQKFTEKIIVLLLTVDAIEVTLEHVDASITMVVSLFHQYINFITIVL